VTCWARPTGHLADRIDRRDRDLPVGADRDQRALQRMNNARVNPDGTPTAELEAATARVKLVVVLELVGFLVIFTCMILMRFGQWLADSASPSPLSVGGRDENRSRRARAHPARNARGNPTSGV